MPTEPARSRTPGADLFLPSDGLSLLGEDQGSGCAGRRFLVGLSDGQVIQLPLMLYLIMTAIAEGDVDGGWNADQVSARVGAASGQRLTVDNVRYLVAGKLAPLGLIVAGDAGQPDRAQPPLVRRLPALRLRFRPAAGRIAALRRHRRRWTLVIGGTAVLLSTAAVAPIMAGTGDRAAGGLPPASASASQAAAWVAQQVSPDVAVSCDPGMCRQLKLDGFPAARLKPLPRSAHGSLRSGVVVATPAVRSQLGPRLAAAWPPRTPRW
jgi:hypothetical protein